MTKQIIAAARQATNREGSSHSIQSRGIRIPNASDETPRKPEGKVPDPLERLLRGGNRGVRTVVWIVLSLAALAILWTVVSYYWTNYLWYKEMGHTNVFWTPFLGRLLVGLFFALVFFGLFYGSAKLAHRLSPKFRPVEGDKSGNVLEMISRRRWSGRALLRSPWSPRYSWASPTGAAGGRC